MTEKPSLFQSAEAVGNGRKLLAYLLDILTAFILTLFIFLMVDGIGSNTSQMKSSTSEIGETKNSLYSLVNSSKLDEQNDSGNLKGSVTISKRFIISSTLASLERNNVSDISSSTYSGYSAITADTDNSYYYYVTFKSDNNSDYLDTDADKAKFGESYYLSLLTENTKGDYFEATGYPFFTLETAQSIDNYLRDSNYSIGSTIYTNVLNGYETILALGTSEYTSYYSPYLDLYQVYLKQSTWIYKVKHIECLVSFIVAELLVYLLAPAILKDGKTVTYKIMKIGVCTKDGFAPKTWNNLLRMIVISIESLFIIPLTFLVFYGTEAFGLLDIALIPGLSMIAMAIGSLIFTVLSYVFCFINKETHQSISEFLSFLVCKDSREYVITRNMENKDGKQQKD